MKKITLTLFSLVFSIFFANAQSSCPPNIDFELGNYSRWHYYTGSCCPLTTPTYSGYGTPDLSRITLMSGAASDPCCSFPVVPPGAGAYTLKIGNASAGTGAPHSQKARFNFHVPSAASNYRFFYRTATVLQDAGHALSQQPRLEVRLVDSATGVALTCHNYDVTTSAAGTYSTSACGATPVKCKMWTTHSIDLSSYAGAVVGIEFATSDCGVDGHFGYAYVDLNCGVMPTSVAATCSSTTVTLLGVPGYVYYSWYDSSSFAPVLATTQNMTIPNPVVPATYACVALPFAGFGCPDTFYVTALPLPSTFPSGTVNATSSVACLDENVALTYSGVMPALNYQWESSMDSLTWTPMSGETLPACNVTGSDSVTYYRCVASCASSGFNFFSLPQKVTSCSIGRDILSVRFWSDVNNDCVKQVGEFNNYTPLLVKIDSAGIPIDTVSAISGVYYRAAGPVGTTYTFSLLSGLFTSACPGSSVSHVIDTSAIYPTKWLGLTCTGSASPNVGVYSVLRSGRHNQMSDAYIVNQDNTPAYVVLTSNHSPKYFPAVYFSATTVATTSGNAATWVIGPLSVLDAPVHRISSVEKSVPWLTVGDTVKAQYTGFAVSGTDADSSDNYFLIRDTVKASYDPNFVSVSVPCFDVDTSLMYTIHFENLGNDTAHNVYILDTLSDKLDANSLRVHLASAAMDISTYKAGGYNIVLFSFPNIKLLDSSQHGLNDGAVFYSIKPLPGLVTGTNITARAGIYFDDNEVIMTNTASTLKGCPVVNGVSSSLQNSNVEIFPNPAKEELIIKSESGTYKSFSITNTLGQVMRQHELSSALQTVNIKSLPAGMYYVIVKADGFSTVLKFVKN